MGAISSIGNEPGNPVIDRSICIFCGACVSACPVGVLTQESREVSIDRHAAFGCIACGQCMMSCPLDCISVTGRGVKPTDLVDLPAAGQRAEAGQLEALMLARRSIRKFTSRDVSKTAIEQVLAAAATAPMGIPPWEVGVTVFHGRDRVGELARDTADAYEKFLAVADNRIAGSLMGLVMKKGSAESLRSFIIPLGRELVAGRKAGKDLALYDAPVALMFHASPYVGGEDAFIACTYAMLAAEALGLGTCMIGCVAPMIARNRSLLRKYGIPEGHTPKLVLIMGYPANHYRKAIRRGFHSVNYY